MFCTAPAPSPTAEATRFIDPRRTSPTANTPGILVSKLIGCRPNGHWRKLTSCPVTMKSLKYVAPLDPTNPCSVWPQSVQKPPLLEYVQPCRSSWLECPEILNARRPRRPRLQLPIVL